MALSIEFFFCLTESQKPCIYPPRQSMMAGQRFCWSLPGIDTVPGLTLQNWSQTRINESVMGSESAIATEPPRLRLSGRGAIWPNLLVLEILREGYQSERVFRGLYHSKRIEDIMEVFKKEERSKALFWQKVKKPLFRWLFHSQIRKNTDHTC